ncbi:9563_t:CDS:1, partial [Entrophospora sp. SA101]
ASFQDSILELIYPNLKKKLENFENLHQECCNSDEAILYRVKNCSKKDKRVI